MKVLFVSSGTSKVGISPLVYNQGESLKKSGIDITYFTIRHKGIAGYLLNVFKLSKFLLSNKFDLIHAHYGLSGLVALFSKHVGTKLIISFMGTDLLGIQNRKGKVTIAGRLLSAINIWLSAHADYCIVKSKQMEGKLSCRNKIVIPNGVDISKFHPIDKLKAMERVGWKNDSIHVFYMADPSRVEKNYALAAEAVKRLNNPMISLHEMYNIEMSEVVYYYNAADVCLLTSFHEGSPNVIKEAMTCNSRIVSTSVGDIDELIGELAGCFITSFNPEQMATAMMKALEYNIDGSQITPREKLLKMGLDSESVAKRIINIYEKVIC